MKLINAELTGQFVFVNGKELYELRTELRKV